MTIITRDLLNKIKDGTYCGPDGCRILIITGIAPEITAEELAAAFKNWTPAVSIRLIQLNEEDAIKFALVLRQSKLFLNAHLHIEDLTKDSLRIIMKALAETEHCYSDRLSLGGMGESRTQLVLDFLSRCKFTEIYFRATMHNDFVDALLRTINRGQFPKNMSIEIDNNCSDNVVSKFWNRVTTGAVERVDRLPTRSSASASEGAGAGSSDRERDYDRDRDASDRDHRSSRKSDRRDFTGYANLERQRREDRKRSSGVVKEDVALVMPAPTFRI